MHWIAAGLLALSLLAKAWGITLFAVLLVLDWRPLRRIDAGSLRGGAAWPVIVQKWPFALLAGVFAVLAAAAQRSGSPDTMKTLEQWGIAERIAQACYGLVFYGWKTLAPTGLAALYELPVRIDWREPRWGASIGIVALAGVAAAWLVARGRAGAAAAALLVYTIVLSPVLGLAQSGIQLVADRYSYLALMSLAVVLTAGLAGVLGRLRTPGRWASLGGVALLAGVLGTLTWRQSAVWQSTIGLWEHALAVGQDGPVLRNLYGRQLEKAGRPLDAIAQYRLSLSMDPAYADSWFGIGNAARNAGRFQEAEEAFLSAARLARDPTREYLALGLLYIRQLDRPADAVGAFERAVEACERAGNPARTGRPYLMLAGAYDALGDYAAEEKWLREAAKWPDSRAEAIDFLRDLPRR